MKWLSAHYGNSLKIKILFPILLTTLLGFMFVAFFGYYTSSKMIKASSEAVSMNKVEKLVAAVNGKMEKWTAQVEDITYADELQTMDVNQLKNYVSKRDAIYRDYELFFIADTKGQALCTSGPKANIAQMPYFKEALQGQIVVSDPVLFATILKPVFIIAAPMKDEQGNTVGIIGGAISLKLISDIINSETYGETGYAYMISKNQLFIAYPQQDESPLSALSILEENVNKNTSISLRKVLGEMVQGKSAVQYYTVLNQEKMVAYSSIKRTGWSVAVTIPYAEVKRVTDNYGWSSIAVTVPSLAMIMLLLILAISKKVTDPIHTLAVETDGFAKGELDRRIKGISRDEIGQLGDKFNQMANSIQSMLKEQNRMRMELQAANEGLEKKVSERTAELANVNTELMTINVELQGTNHALENEIEERRKVEQNLALLNQELTITLEKLKATQNQLILQEKMAALGSLVAGVAHEINTPIGVGVSMATFLEKEMDTIKEKLVEGQLSKQAFKEFLEHATESVMSLVSNLNRAAELINSFKKVAVNQTSDIKTAFNVNETIHDTLLSFKSKLKHTGHEIKVQCSQTLEVKSYPGAIYQILTNLLMNSLIHGFAETDSGLLTIAVEVQEQMMILTYEDNGKGMDEETLKNIFTPFFTTTRNRGGTGLGLSIVYNLVTQKLQGTITCESQLGKGTLFSIKIPVDQ